MNVKIIEGDCLEQTRQYENYFDSIVTDPPYGLKFMGKEWDHGVPGKNYWERFLQSAKPGAHLLAFGGTRTHHRLMVAIEDAGWEIRDTLMWVYGSGFPKSLDVSKAIDKAAGVEREVIGVSQRGSGAQPNKLNNHGKGDTGIGYADGSGKVFNITTPATDSAKQWSGWGTALKPAWEPIILARKPLEGTVAENVLKWGCGGINVDRCRVPVNPLVDDMLRTTTRIKRDSEVWENGSGFKNENNSLTGVPANGRFPANLIHDGSDEVMELFPNTTSGKMMPTTPRGIRAIFSGDAKEGYTTVETYGDFGSAARFFYCAKASKSERNFGCDNLPLKSAGECTDRQDGTAGLNSPRAGAGRTNGSRNTHPTVKPIALMRYLCRLITPPNGIVLDPFAGSGSTGVAATLEGFNCILIEIETGSANIARARNGVEVL